MEPTCLLFELLNADVQDLHIASLAFLDDVYFTSTSLAEAQEMLNEAFDHFSTLGLRINLGKLKWMANKY